MISIHKGKSIYSHKLPFTCVSQPTGSEESLTTTQTRGDVKNVWVSTSIPIFLYVSYYYRRYI